MMRSPFALLCVASAVAALTFGACNCGGDGGGDGGTDSGSDGGGGGGGDGGGGGNDGGGDAGPTCVPVGNACSTSGQACCSGSVCSGGTCSLTCNSYGETCSQGFECCSGNCTAGGTCGCKQTGTACSSPSECCTGTCTGGTCQNVPGQTCRVTGLACQNDFECCSGNCNGGFCTPVFSCQAYHDVCTYDGECCSFVCNKQAGATAGTCNEPSGAGGCTGAGNPCTRSSDCCSRVCADFGAGGMACQPTIGCRPQGDNCATTGSCCGSATCTLPGHKCDNGTACRGAGMICGKPMTLLADGGFGPCATVPGGTGCYTTNQETNCCDSVKVGGNEYMCRVDVGGVPRCFGGLSGQCPVGYTGQPPCCISAGDYCDFKDQCCNGLPCTIGADGGRQCVAPECKGAGSACGSTSECCSPTQCLPTGEIGNACQVPGDGGTACSGNDAGCTSPSSCCSGFCTNGTCTPPPICQPQGANCNSSADCCTNPPLTCVIGSGSTSGTCQPGSTCLNIGQACTQGSNCCAGLLCVDPQGLNCGSTGSGCSCQVIIN